MFILLVFLVFAAAMAASLALDITMLAPLGLGLILFSVMALCGGTPLRQLLRYMAGSLKDSFIVIRILLIIGCLIGAWRQSGTIACFVSFGVTHMPAGLFLPAAFLLAAAMSYAIGTSFGVTATAGVILISIARAAGVDPVLTAGAILSGVYVGDRGSPASSSANLVSVLTRTDMRRNIRSMLKSSLPAFLLCPAAYALLSLRTPVGQISREIPGLLAEEFDLSLLCLIPAAVMIILPFAGVKIRIAMLISLVSALLLSLLLQKAPTGECLRCLILGYTAKNAALSGMLSGGGLVSMLEVCGILLLSGTYGGIFRGTGMLSGMGKRLQNAAGRIGHYPVMLLLSLGICGLFCNQTIGAIMQSQLSGPLYGEDEEERYAKMADIEDSVILTAGLVPWCIASSVPLGMLGADARSLPFAFYLWMVPLCRLAAGLIRKKRKGVKKA